jgi:hypothetical protein
MGMISETGATSAIDPERKLANVRFAELGFDRPRSGRSARYSGIRRFMTILVLMTR